MSASGGIVIKYGLRRPLSTYKLLRSLSNRPCKIFTHPSLPSNFALERITSCHALSYYSSNSTKPTDCDTESLDVTYEDVKKAQGDREVLIIDVREDDEIRETGKLPGSVHIPMRNVARELTVLSRQAFRDKYHKDKPSVSTEIILSCRSGKRSQSVQQELHKMGYTKALNYSGGWKDWEKNSRNENE